MCGLSGDLEHPVQGQTRIGGNVRINRNLIDDTAIQQIFKRPQEVLRIDAEHSGAEASAIIERDNEPVRILFRQAVHKMDLCADSPFRAGGRLRETSDNVLGRAEIICELNDFKSALRVGNYPDAGIPCTDLRDVLR